MVRFGLIWFDLTWLDLAWFDFFDFDVDFVVDVDADFDVYVDCFFVVESALTDLMCFDVVFEIDVWLDGV